MEKYLLSYIKNNTSNPLIKKYIDYLKIELDWYMYNYGDHMSITHCRKKNYTLRNKLYDYFYYLFLLKNAHTTIKEGKNILSSISNKDFQYNISKLGYNLYSSILQPTGKTNLIGNSETIKLIKYKKNAIQTGYFNDLLNIDFLERIESCRLCMINEYSQLNFEALFLYSDQYFESKLLIDVFKSIQRPSFVFLHGLPGIYSLDVDNRSDYLMVWSEKIKENYIKSGFNANKILVTGNIKYPHYETNLRLKNSLEDILIIPKSSVLWHQHEWGDPKLIDRNIIILYLYSIQNVLTRLGVKSVRYRPHPSIKSEWVHNFIDNNFFKIDRQNLEDSLKRSTMVIGATSTVFLEALMYGVNYIVYEPKINETDLLSDYLVPPFDGSDKEVIIANSENDLLYVIKNKEVTDISFLRNYMQPFDNTAIKKVLSNI